MALISLIINAEQASGKLTRCRLTAKASFPEARNHNDHQVNIDLSSIVHGLSSKSPATSNKLPAIGHRPPFIKGAMRAVIQRVSEASVTVEGEVVGQIGAGLLILLGIGQDDDGTTAELIAEKIATMRIFPDDAGRFDRSLVDIGGSALVVSQFTLFGDLRRGRRPSFSDAAAPEHAAPLVELVAEALRRRGITVATGRFAAHMHVALVNDGPVTIILDSATLREPRRVH